MDFQLMLWLGGWSQLHDIASLWHSWLHLASWSMLPQYMALCVLVSFVCLFRQQFFLATSKQGWRLRFGRLFSQI